MPPHTIRDLLVPRSFHQGLVGAMTTRAGFTRMYEFVATTDRDTFYVPATYAQETTHIFYLPDRGFLVRLALTEHIDEDGHYRSWWTGGVYLELDVDEMIAYQVFHLCSTHPDRRFDCEPMGHIFDTLESLLAPFRVRGGNRQADEDAGSYGWRLEYDSHSEPLTVEQLVAFADGLRTHFGPFLKPTLSYHFDVSGFTSEYSWPGLRERFWRNFPTKLLKDMVPGRIRGRQSARA